MRNVEPMRAAAGVNRSHMESIKQERRATQRDRQQQRKSDRSTKRSQAY